MSAVGIDLLEIERLERALERRPRLAERLFTEGERAYALRKNDPTERLAARFAVKEATMKALGVGLGAFKFHDVEVVKKRTGEPTLSLSGRALDLAAARGVTEWKVSITHSDLIAMAVVIAQ